MNAKETPCSGCAIAAARISAELARVLVDSATYWTDPNDRGIATFIPVIEAGRHIYRRAYAIMQLKPTLPHTCGGNPARCTTCHVPLITADAPCVNLVCGAPLRERDVKIACGPLRAMHTVAATDVAIAWVELTYAHHGGESCWPCVVYATLDGDIYHASGMHPFDLPEEEVRKLPSRDRTYAQPTDHRIGGTRERTFSRFNGETNEDAGISWYDAYERPDTGERFKIYDWDGE